MKALALAPVLALAGLMLVAPARVEAGHRHGRGCGHSYYDRGHSGYGGTRYYNDYYGGRYYGRGDYGRDYERRYYGSGHSHGRYGHGYRAYPYGYAGYPAYGYGYYPPPPPPRYCPPRPRVGIYFGF